MAAARVTSLQRDAAWAAGLLGTATADHLAGGGGAWRVELALDCCEALGVSPSDATVLAAACELVHQASIVHDDAQDAASMRRGRPSVAARFGAPVAICVGDHLLSSAFGVLAGQASTLGLVRMFASRISEMAAGQAGEFATDFWDAMTLDHYRVLAGGKAGAATTLPLEGAALLAGLPDREVRVAGEIGWTLGLAYQVIDDVSDVAVDLCHGALNAVVVFALQDLPALQRAALLKLLARARKDGLSVDEAEIEAARLGTHAERASQWARTVLAGMAGDVAGHRLGAVLGAAAAGLARRLDAPSEQCHAA